MLLCAGENCVICLTPDSFAHWSWKQHSGRGGHRHKLLQSTGKYDPHFLVQVLLFSCHVRGVSKYSPYMDIFRRAFRCFPASVQMVSEQILDGAVVPSASTMSRARLYVDCGWMLRMRMLLRKLITSEGVVIGMLDSSPQAGRNLLMHEISYVCGEDLPVVG